jgi:uncharacterized protein (DUF362 family)
VIRRLAFVLCLLPLALRAQTPVDQLQEETPVVKAIPAKSRVYYAMDPRALYAGYQVNPAVAQAMVDAVVVAATGKNSVQAAWASLVGPKDIVGIKIAAAPGVMAGTHPDTVRAVAHGLESAGIPADHIIVWDRNRADLITDGYSEHDPDYRLDWIAPAAGYDRQAPLTEPVLGKLIWGDAKFGDRKGMRFEDILANGDQLSSTSYYATILSKKVTKVINMPSLCDSYMCGLNGAIANMTIWNVDNWRRFAKDPSYGDPYLAEIYADPMVRDKVVFTIMDALAVQFAGGPTAYPNFTRQNLTIYGSMDPVAIDATAVKLIDELRLINKLPPIKTVAAHVQSAASMGLGNGGGDDVELVRVGLGNAPR